MKLLIIIATFCAIFVVRSCNINILSTKGENSDKCPAAGLQCDGCKKVIMCIKNGDDFQVQPIQTCDIVNGETCYNGACTTDPNPHCLNDSTINFPCTTVAFFPDQFDCQSYHLCCDETTEQGITKTCEGNYSYDPLTAYCKNKLPSTGCPSTPPIPPCKKAGESGAFPGNKSIYYICIPVINNVGDTILYPKLFLCPNGKIYSGNSCI